MNVYETKTMAQRLSGNSYPGRGIVLGVTPDGKQAVLKIYKTAKTSRPADGLQPGELVVERRQLYVATADGLLQLVELQLAGKKRMTADSFVNGMKGLDASRVE